MSLRKYELRTLDLNGQINGLTKEIAFRERKFPELVESGKMNQSFAAFQIDLFKQILGSLKRLREMEG